MFDLSDEEATALCIDIAARAGTANELALAWDLTTSELKEFVSSHKERLTVMRARLEAGEAPTDPVSDSDVPISVLDALWITKKSERLTRYQKLADRLYEDALHNGLSGADLSTAVREFRSYLTVVANELGQLMHRGSGEAVEGTNVNYNIQGIDMDMLK